MLKDINYYGIDLKDVEVEIIYFNLHKDVWNFSVEYTYNGETLPTGNTYSISYVEGQDPLIQAYAYLEKL